MKAGAAYTDPGRVRAALAHIPADDRETWLRMGMAIKSELADAGFDLWESWSQQAESFNGRDARDVWKSIRAGGGVTIGTLFHEAKQHGWRDDRHHQKPSPEEITERRRIAEERTRREQAEIEAERADTAKKAAALWKAATPATPANPYLERKGVAPVPTLREIGAGEAAAILGYSPKSGGEPLTGRLLVVPVKQGDRLSTIELIDGTGRKTALAGRGSKAGGFWAAQPLPDADGPEPLLIGEGVATALSAEATGYPAVAALSSGNLVVVAQAMRQQYPTRPIIILGDLAKATGEPDPHAIEAAKAVDGRLGAPDFGPNREPGQTDFNDLARNFGPEAVRRAIDKVLFQDEELLYVTPYSEVEDVAYQKDKPCSKKGNVDTHPGTEPGDSEGLNTLSKNGVSGVAGVAPYCDKASGCNTSENSGVAGVASPIPKTEDRPCFRVLDDWVEHGGTKYRPGVWHFDTDKDGNLVSSWICSPLHVDAVTFDGQDNNFGRLLRFKNTLGRWREWAMPMELLAGLGNEIRAELLAMGVEIAPRTAARNRLATFLQASPPARRMRCALQVGWAGTSFVLPDVVIGPGASQVIFQSGERGHEEHTRAGISDDWRDGIAARAVGNPLLTLAISAAFAGPMLGPCHTEGGGIHFVGDSSTGKTTAIEAACSVWGGPNFRRSWRATANGMEGVAALFNDCLLALDEISECDPREVGAIVYALGNGKGKQRASRTGAARGVTRWRCFVLSSGERTLGTHMNEAGHRAKAGQSVRMLDVPTARRFGAWDDLHGFTSGAAFSDAIRRAAATHHGHAGRAFLERLTRDTRDFSALLETAKALKTFQVEGSEGQDKRAAARFALIGLAGELATEYGVTGWAIGDAIQAAGEGFRLWQSLRGRGNDERRQILERVSDFIERHGDGRFSCALGSDVPIRDRAGWWRDTGETREYLFTSAGMREALAGFDFGRALAVLQEAGALPAPGTTGKSSDTPRINGRSVRVYRINPDKLEAANVA